MLDFTLIREQPDRVREALLNRNLDLDLTPLLTLDEKRRATIREVEALKSERNSRSKEIGILAKAGGDIAQAKSEMRDLGERISSFDETLRDLDEEIRTLCLNIPHLPHE